MLIGFLHPIACHMTCCCWLQPEGVEPGSKPFSSFGGSLINMMEDLSWAKDAEPILDTHLGEGSAAFRWEEEGRWGRSKGACRAGLESDTASSTCCQFICLHVRLKSGAGCLANPG
jgi:hypothetical protein